MPEHPRTSPHASASTASAPARSDGGASGPGANVAKNDEVDALGATIAGDQVAPVQLEVAATPGLTRALARTLPLTTETPIVSRVIPVGAPAEREIVGATTNEGLAVAMSDRHSPVPNAAALELKKAQTLSGLAPPPELKAEADAMRAQRQAVANRPGPPPSVTPPPVASAPATKLPGPPPRPGVGKPGSTPPPPASAAPRGPGFAPPPRPGTPAPPRLSMQPPPIPPAMAVPALRPSAAPPAGFVPQEGGRRVSRPMPAVNTPLSDQSKRSSPAMPAIQAPPVPGDLRRSAQGMPAIQPPPVPSDLRRSAQAMPAVTPPPAPVDPRRSSQAMPAVAPPAADGFPSAEDILHQPLPAGTIPMTPVAHASSPGPGVPPGAAGAPSFTHAPRQMIYAAGTVIGGKYRLERALGQGGMGAVWVVKNLSLGADFALKLVRRDRATEEAAARLLTEAQAAAKLGHPGIVRVFDFGQTEVGDPYLVMELLTGESLGALITRKKRLEPSVAVQMLLPVAAALSAAHGKGIVHRDLKPDNIMLATEDSSRKLVPKVLDFGIARVLRDDVERHQTMAGEVLGSPDYMSPEQARGQLDIDHRTDIWTFSVLLYESITGKRPFEGHNYNALIASIVSNPPMPVHAYGIADTDLSAIIDRGLSKSPATRWQTMRDMGIALAQWAIDHGINNDITGLSIQTEWLASVAPHLVTLQPAQLPRLTVPGAEPQGAGSTAPVVAKDGAEWSGLRGDGRAKWFVGGAVFLAVAGVVGFAATSMFSSTGAGTDSDAGAAPASSQSAVTTPPPPPVAPSPAVSNAPASQPSAKASSSATTKTPVVPPPTFKRKAPPVPTNIKF